MASYKKKEGCCNAGLLKCVLSIFNLIFLLSGCGVLGLGLWTILFKHEYVCLLTSHTYVATTFLLIIAGCAVIIISIIGCIGMLKKNRCCLLLYTFLLLLVFLLEAVTGMIAYIYQEQVMVELRNTLNDTFITTYSMDKSCTRAIDELQRKFKCCGAVEFEDWKYSKWAQNHKNGNNKVPDSCCKTESPECGRRDHPSNIYYDGCTKALGVELSDNLVLLGVFGLGISVVQIFGMIISCCLYIHLREYKYGHY